MKLQVTDLLVVDLDAVDSMTPEAAAVSVGEGEAVTVGSLRTADLVLQALGVESGQRAFLLDTAVTIREAAA